MDAASDFSSIAEPRRRIVGLHRLAHEILIFGAKVIGSRFAGAWFSWLERLPVTEEVAGSSPVAHFATDLGS